MNQHRVAGTLLAACLALFLISCGGNEPKSNAETTSDTTATTTPTEQPQTSSIVTTPQNMLVIKHKVANYEKWKVAYDGHDSARLANGVHNYVIARGMQDSNMLLVATKIDDVAKAKAFSKEPSLKQAMQKGGVIGAPTVRFVTMVFQDTSTIDSKLRALATFTVKDWDAWQKSFDSAMKLNTDNGLKPRAYGYDPDDHHKVSLVVAVLDTAKARAFWNSDLLKQRRAASGVVGQPERFLYNVVQVTK